MPNVFTLLRLAEVGLTKTKPFSAVSDKYVLTGRDQARLTFSGIVTSASTPNPQVDLHQKLKPYLASLFQGKSCAVFALGASSSGKSFCIQGTKEYPGLLPRTVEYLFGYIEK